MKNFVVSALALFTITTLSPAWAQEQDPGIAAVADLARINGQALACQEVTVVSRAKKLMLAHAPKVQRYGAVFEDGTNQAYLEQSRGSQACPDLALFYQRLDVVTATLQKVLPIAASDAR